MNTNTSNDTPAMSTDNVTPSYYYYEPNHSALPQSTDNATLNYYYYEPTHSALLQYSTPIYSYAPIQQDSYSYPALTNFYISYAAPEPEPEPFVLFKHPPATGSTKDAPKYKRAIHKDPSFFGEKHYRSVEDWIHREFGITLEYGSHFPLSLPDFPLPFSANTSLGLVGTPFAISTKPALVNSLQTRFLRRLKLMRRRWSGLSI